MIPGITKIKDILTTIHWHNKFFPGMNPKSKSGAYWVKSIPSYWNVILIVINFSSQKLLNASVNIKYNQEARTISIE